MSPARRREWFTTLSEVSYDYALGVYAKLREKYRDTSGALKHAKKRLVQEKSKIISSSELDKIKAEVDQIHKELDLLFQNRNAVTRSEEQVKRDIATSQQELQTLLNNLINVYYARKLAFTNITIYVCRLAAFCWCIYCNDINFKNNNWH
jgi:FtsZ-binding cell division protein ZapB